MNAAPHPLEPPSPAPTRLRLFVALHLSPEQLQLLRQFQAKLQAAILSKAIRWSNPQQLHLTLQFLGAIPVGQLPDLETALAHSASAISPIEICLHGAGAFPNLMRPRVLWAGVTASPELFRLQTQIAQHSARFTKEPEDRPFHPHLTLARIKDSLRLPPSGRQLLESPDWLAGPSARISEFALMKSTTSSTGAVYEQLAAFPLSGVAG